MNANESPLSAHPVVSREEWLTRRIELLKQEKALTCLRDEQARRRRELPWVALEKEYVFDAPGGRRTLAELFDGRSQLFVKHFMFAPGWEEGCVGCSFEVDHAEGALVHLANHDVTYVAISRAPLAELEAFKRRMGWRFTWVSSFGSDFNYDFHVSFRDDELERGEGVYNYETIAPFGPEASGNSVFFKDASGKVFHTYSTFGRGAEELLGSYAVLDLTPKGRDENGPARNLTDWVRHHDRYGAGGFVDGTGRYVASEAPGGSGECCRS